MPSTPAVLCTPPPLPADRFDVPSWPLVTGVLIGLSFPPYGLYVLAFVALVPLLIRWSRATSLLALAAETYSAFLLAFALSGYWVLFHEARWAALLSGLSLLALPLPLVVPVVLSAAVRRRSGAGARLCGAGDGRARGRVRAVQRPTRDPVDAARRLDVGRDGHEPVRRTHAARGPFRLALAGQRGDLRGARDAPPRGWKPGGATAAALGARRAHRGPHRLLGAAPIGAIPNRHARGASPSA